MVGRWLAFIIYAVTLSGHDLAGAWYQASLLGAFVCFFIAFALAAGLAMPTAPLRHRLAVAALLLAIFWTGAPGLGEVLYWHTGMVAYALPFALTAACFWLAARPGLGRLTLAAIAAVAAAGLSEIAGLVCTGGVALLIAWRHWHGRPTRLLLPLLIACAAGLILNVAAPGNAVRAGEFDRMSLPMIAWTVARPYKSILSFLGDPRMLALTLLLLTLPAPPGERPRGLWLLGTGGLAIAALTIAGVAWAQGMAPADRVLAFLYGGLICLWFGLAWAWRGVLAHAGWRGAAAAVLALLLVTAPPVGAVLQDAKEALAWRERQRADLASLSGHAVVPDRRPPALLGAAGVTADPRHWSNLCLADYFGLRSIRSTSDPR